MRGKQRCIASTHSKANQCTHISQYRIKNVGFTLSSIMASQHHAQAQAAFAKLRKHACICTGAKEVKFIHIKEVGRCSSSRKFWRLNEDAQIGLFRHCTIDITAGTQLFDLRLRAAVVAIVGDFNYLLKLMTRMGCMASGALILRVTKPSRDSIA